MADTPLIDIKGIHKSFSIGDQVQHVLRGVDLTIQHGELVSIMGQSGSGKSTAMNIIGLLDKPDEGTYQFEGEDIADLMPDELAYIRNETVGFVFQSFFLLTKFSALENVGLPLMYRGLPRAEINERAMEIIEKVGMAPWANHKPKEMSGGQQQRIAIARALVGEPSLVLADEPTGALDPIIGKEVLDLFIKINEEQGATLIVITHDKEVAAACKRRVKMVGGQIVRDN
jgi:putative ABC transport system ATP-binding protein